MGIRYEDKFVKVTDEALTIKDYTFMKKPREVPFGEIQKLVVKKATWWNGMYRTLGTGDFIIWFAYDDRRFERDCLFILTVKGKYWRVGFSVEDPERFVKVMEGSCTIQDRFFRKRS